MLNLNYGNQVERLAEQLLDHLCEPTADPLLSDWVVVSHASMGRWLAQRKAARDGICANVEFLYPAIALWRLLRAAKPDLPAENPLRREVLTLRILQCFGAAAEDARLAPLSTYLAAKDDLGWYRLARRLAEGFDQYLIFRPDWILEWEDGAAPHWQAALWQRLADPAQWHWARCWQWLRDQDGASIAAAVLPPRLSVFAVPGLAPGFMDTLAQFAAHTQIDVYQWSPSRHYWGDARSPRARSGADSLEGNPLLPSLALPLRDTLDWWLEWPCVERQDYLPGSGENLLGRLQNSLLEYCVPASPETVPGSGLEIHVCSSRRREVEVCHDRLLGLFEADPSLAADEVLVVSPDIGAYLPYVRAIFSRIPWNEHGRAGGRGKGVVESMAAILRVLSRPQLDRSVLELLAFAPIRRSFELRSEDLADTRRWAREGGLYGVEEGKFSWQQGAERLIAATLIGAPVDDWPAAERVHGSEGQAIGRFLGFLDAMIRLHQAAGVPRSLPQWGAWGRDLISRCLQATAADQGPLRALRQALWRISQSAGAAACTRPVAFPVFRELMRAEMEFFAGDPIGAGASVSFASLSAARLMPARVLYALGLNEGEFPALQSGSDLDLIAHDPRRGDRSRRQEDRQVFLEWLGAARERLLLSYVGVDARDGAKLAASPLVDELLDHLDRHYQLADGDPSWNSLKPSERIVTYHPVQPFSSRYGHQRGMLSYADHFNVAAGDEPRPFQVGPVTLTSSAAIAVADLIDFIRLPAKHYLRGILGIWLDIPQDLLPHEPPVELDALSRYRLLEGLMRERGALAAAMRARISAAVATPEGPLGEAVSADLIADAGRLICRRRELTGNEQGRELTLEASLGGARLTGRVDRIFDQGRVVLHAGTIRGKHLLELWVNHLLLNLAALRGDAAVEGRISMLIGSRSEVSLRRPADPEAVLEELIEVYRQGQRRAAPFFPDASRAFAERSEDPGKARREALRVFTPGFRQPFAEGANVYVRLAFRDESWASEGFEALALQVWGPLLAHLDEPQSARPKTSG